MRGGKRLRSEAGTVTPSVRVRFKLYDDLAAGGNVDAWICDEEFAPTARKIKVHDALGSFSGAAGANGYAEYWADSGKFEIYQMECP